MWVLHIFLNVMNVQANTLSMFATTEKQVQEVFTLSWEKGSIPVTR